MIPSVHIVDDDPVIRDALRQLLELSGFRVEVYADGAAFLAQCSKAAGCVVLDMAMPGIDGHEVQSKMQEHGIALPVIFLSGHSEIPDAVQAMQDGALDFLQKPVQTDRLLQCVRRALAKDASHREHEQNNKDMRLRYAKLTAREWQVMSLVVEGLGNKQIANRLGLSPRTVEVHRNHVMQKMGAESLAQLVKFSTLDLSPPAARPQLPAETT